MIRTATGSRWTRTVGWIRALAEPYLRGYQPEVERTGSLRGYWFLRPARASGASKPLARRSSQTAAGFFVGYLIATQNYTFLNPQPPECIVFAFVRPVGGASHRRLVKRPGSLLRETFDYIQWLTHRPPRFAFHEAQLAALVRHLSIRDWPRAKYAHYSRNFFIETLAWLVRSGLVRKFAAEFFSSV